MRYLYFLLFIVLIGCGSTEGEQSNGTANSNEEEWVQPEMCKKHSNYVAESCPVCEEFHK